MESGGDPFAVPTKRRGPPLGPLHRGYNGLAPAAPAEQNRGLTVFALQPKNKICWILDHISYRINVEEIWDPRQGSIS